MTLKAKDDMLAADLSAEEMSKGRLQREVAQSAEVVTEFTFYIDYVSVHITSKLK